MAGQDDLTFSQRHGLEPVPEPLKLGEISQEFRSIIWYSIFEQLRASKRHGYTELRGPWAFALYDYHVFHLHFPADEFTRNYSRLVEITKTIIWKSSFHELFDFLEFVMRSRHCPGALRQDVREALEQACAAYTVVDEGPTIVPAATAEEGAAIQEAFDSVRKAGIGGAATHLRKAAESINKGEYAESVRESIHAVESVARQLDPEASNTLGPALAALQRGQAIHPALEKGFKKIYGYTSDKDVGVRHALHEDEADVDQVDAVFMVGACASFITYMVNKARKVGLLKE